MPPHTRFFNPFPGWRAPVGPAAPELIQPIIDHLLVVYCAGVLAHYNWLMNWLANLVQNPRVKPGTIVVLRSEQGAGKDVFLEFFGLRVMGDGLFYQTKDIDKVIGRFNSCVEAKRLIALNEISMPCDKWHSTMDKFKSMATDPTVTIERKNQEPRVVKDFSAYIVCSNNDSPLRIEKSDRRTMCLEVSNEKIGDTDYFEPLVELCERHPDTPAAFMAHLMSIEVDKQAVHRPIETEMKRALKFDHIPPAARFLQDALERWQGG